MDNSEINKVSETLNQRRITHKVEAGCIWIVWAGIYRVCFTEDTVSELLDRIDGGKLTNRYQAPEAT